MKLLRALPLLVGILTPAISQAATPTQYIAKVYTEMLGRAPDPSGWNANVNYFHSSGCSVATLRQMGQTTLASSEFSNIGYNNPQKVLILYRAILDREPDSSGLTSHTAQLDNGTALSQVADGFYQSQEFSNLAQKVCSGAPYYYSVQAAGNAATQIPGATQVNEADVQNILNNMSPGGVLSLQNSAVVVLTTPLIIPPGRTLTTDGSPSPNAHAKMARLVRSLNFQHDQFGDAMVELKGGAALVNVWVDGQRGVAGFSNGVPTQDTTEPNIRILSGNGGSVSNDFISNSYGWTSLLALGMAETGISCSNVSIKNNVITDYASNDGNHAPANTGWSDGISDSCEGSTVSGNNIVDATDGGIVLFRAQTSQGGAVQASQVTSNTIVSAGNYAFGAIILDPLAQDGGGTCYATRGFDGANVTGNTLYASENSGFSIGLSVGTAEWFYNNGNGCTGTGANVSNNTTAGISTRVTDGIAVEGMIRATVQSNNLSVSPSIRVGHGSCRSYVSVAAVSAGQASGSLQTYTDDFIHDCINS